MCRGQKEKTALVFLSIEPEQIKQSLVPASSVRRHADLALPAILNSADAGTMFSSAMIIVRLFGGCRRVMQLDTQKCRLFTSARMLRRTPLPSSRDGNQPVKRGP